MLHFLVKSFRYTNFITVRTRTSSNHELGMSGVFVRAFLTSATEVLLALLLRARCRAAWFRAC